MATPSLAPLLLAREDPHADDPGAEVRLNGVIPRHLYFAIVAFTSIALYNVIELTCIIFTTFKRRSGLYFVSFCVATGGIPLYALPYLVIGVHPDQHPGAIYGFAVLVIIGWTCTVTGQSMVLYSRLYLIDHDRRHLRAVLAMIIINAVVLHCTTTALFFGANSNTNPEAFYTPFSIIEKVHVTVFFLQEVTISALYIWATARFFHDSVLHAASTRAHLLRHLIVVNIVVICVDITILGLEFADLYKVQTSYKAMAYSIKLKLEFRVLNRLVSITRDHESSSISEQGSAARGSGNSLGGAESLGAANTASTGGVESGRPRLSVKWNSCVGWRKRSSQTMEAGGSHDDEPLRELRTAGRANTGMGMRSRDITSLTEERKTGQNGCS